MAEPTPISIAGTFLEKLKEQSFTIMLLVGILYYQNTIFTKQMGEYRQLLVEKEQAMDKLIAEDRELFLAHDKYLRDQRDQYVQELLLKFNHELKK